jgi:hypothetical protein
MTIRSVLVAGLLFAVTSGTVSATTATASIACTGNIDDAIDAALELIYTGGADTLYITLTAGQQFCTVKRAHPITGPIFVSFAGPGVDTGIHMGGTPLVPRFPVSAGAQFNISNVSLSDVFRSAISADSATVFVDSMVFTNDSTDLGGSGITANNSTVTVTHSTFGSNQSQLNGGAIEMEGSGSLLVSDSVFQQNQTSSPGIGKGGAIYSGGPSVTLDRVLFNGNKSTNFDGGAVDVEGADLVVRNSTFTANQAQNGGAIAFTDAGSHSLSLNNVTMRSDVAAFAGPEIYISSGVDASKVSINNTLISGACSGFQSAPAAHNSVESPGNTCQLPASNRTSVADVDLHLGSLAENGGYSFTFAPQAPSVLIDTGGNDCEKVDQRDYTRNVGVCDVGAVEAGATDRIFIGRFE